MRDMIGSVLGGWLADSKLGKYAVILCGMISYLIGTIFLLVGSVKSNPVDEMKAISVITSIAFKKAVHIIGLIFVAFGHGGIIGNDVLFSAEQVPNNGPDTIQSVFSWWFGLINISGLLAFTFVTYLNKNMSGYIYGNALIPACSLILALIAFFTGKSTYIIYPPYGSVVLETVKVTKEAIKKSQRPSTSSSSIDHWLDRAKSSFGGSFSSWEVDDVKKIYRLLPIFVILIFYFALYNQMITTMNYSYQDGYMDMNLEKLPMLIFHPYALFFISVLILLPFTEKVVYPFLEKLNSCPGQLQRIGIGMMFFMVSMAYAGWVEWHRVTQCCIEKEDHLGKNLTRGSDMTVFDQVPQHVLAGIGAVFTTFTAFKFALTETPKYLHGVVMGMMWCITGLGSIVSALLVLIVNAVTGAIGGPINKWYPDKDQINKGHHLAYFLFLLAFLMFLVFIFYIDVALSFKAKKKSAERANLQINEDSSTNRVCQL